MNLIYYIRRAQCRFRIFLKTKHERINQYFASGVRKKDLPRLAQGSKSRLKYRFELFKMRSSEVSLSQTYFVAQIDLEAVKAFTSHLYTFVF